MGKISSHDLVMEPSVKPKLDISVKPKLDISVKPSVKRQVRITVPSTVAQLVKEYNGCQPGKQKDALFAICLDTLSKLQLLIMSSAIYDSSRKDSKEKYDSLSIRDPNTMAQARAKDKTRQFAAEARVSLVMLARCNSRVIRDKAWLLLTEALDINHLSLVDGEIHSLQMLCVELIQVLRQIIEARRQRLHLDDKSLWQSNANAIQCVESVITNALDTRIFVDDTLLSVLIVNHLI
jgi:hypothetical protein